ncbi:hypothetical protein ABID08_003575 [Rhizobium binae]|uniref:Uncharacterized protein n=1 Tax=Rhizobium binae TaxID=1138190 RepID=A0ABV2MI97_9HYPH
MTAALKSRCSSGKVAEDILLRASKAGQVFVVIDGSTGRPDGAEVLFQSDA